MQQKSHAWNIHEKHIFLKAFLFHYTVVLFLGMDRIYPVSGKIWQFFSYPVSGRILDIKKPDIRQTGY